MTVDRWYIAALVSSLAWLCGLSLPLALFVGLSVGVVAAVVWRTVYGLRAMRELNAAVEEFKRQEAAE